MGSSGVTEIISLFSGYLHMAELQARARLDYDEFYISKDIEAFNLEHAPSGARKWDFEGPDSEPTFAFKLPDEPFVPISLSGDELRDRLPGDVSALEPLDPSTEFQGIGSGGGGIIGTFLLRSELILNQDIEIEIQYGDGGGALLLRVHQLNRLIDNDRFQVPEGVSAETYHGIDMEAVKADARLIVKEQVPSELQPDGLQIQDLLDFVGEKDAASKDGTLLGEGANKLGVYVNGVLQADGAELPTLPEDEEEEEGSLTTIVFGHDDPAQLAELGGNTVVNSAGILDLNNGIGTLVVKGDIYKSDIIVQVNAYLDDDLVHTAGGAGYSVESAGNDMNNVASFLHTDLGFSDILGSPSVYSGIDWNVDIYDGDFFDINAVIQENWIVDNDIVFQNDTIAHYEVITGLNELGNFFFEKSIGKEYDLVVVLGDSHHTNWIYQQNFIYDPDIAKLFGGLGFAESDEAPPGTVLTGDNTLLNEAQIDHIGSDTYMPIDEIWLELIGSLVARDTVLDPQLGLGIPNFGDEPLEILLITGDLWNINGIFQSNYIFDADVALQYAELEGYAGGTPLEQLADMGGNTAHNSAKIADVGPVAGSLYGGEFYEDDVLIQAELVISDEDEAIVHNDPQELVNELVAFATQLDEPNPASEDAQTPHQDANSDLLGSMLT